MNFKDFIKNVLRTESVDFKEIKERLQNKDLICLLYEQINNASKSADSLDKIKKHIFYGKKLEKFHRNLFADTNYFDDIKIKLQDKSLIRLIHGIIGTVSESGELLDQIKEHIFNGKKLDKVNIIEEIGDKLFYIAIILNELGVSFEQAMEINSKKLHIRYPEKFNKNNAINRDLDKERKILEEIKFNE